jgi:hypothetical protein
MMMRDNQIAYAASLIKAIRADRNASRNLMALIEAAKLARDANDAARRDRISAWIDPNRLAGFIALSRRADADTRARVQPEYRHLLSAVHGGLARGLPPLQVDYNALVPDARPYLLAPYLGIVVGGSFPRLCFERSQPERGTLTYIVTGGPVDRLQWQPHLEKASAWLGGTWTIAGETATTITLQRREPLPSRIPMHPGWLQAGKLFLGIDVDARRPVHVGFADLAHTLVTGTTGMGKSVALDTILRSLLVGMDAIEHIHAVDPAGIAFGRYQGAHARLTTLSAPEEVWAVTARLVETMTEREQELRRTRREKFTDRFIFLIIDEFPYYNSPDSIDRKSEAYRAHQVFIGHVMALGRRARKTGIRLIFIVQEPTDRDISTGLRSVLPGLLAFRTPVQVHASALFGEFAGLPADPRALERGRALYRDGTTGAIAHVQFPFGDARGRQ